MSEQKKEVRPQVECLMALQKIIGGSLSSHVTICPETGSIEFKLHSGKSIQEIGVNGCFLSEIIKIAMLMQLFYDEKFPNEDSDIFRHLKMAYEERQSFECHALMRMFHAEPYGKKERK